MTHVNQTDKEESVKEQSRLVSARTGQSCQPQSTELKPPRSQTEQAHGASTPHTEEILRQRPQPEDQPLAFSAPPLEPLSSLVPPSVALPVTTSLFFFMYVSALDFSAFEPEQ